MKAKHPIWVGLALLFASTTFATHGAHPGGVHHRHHLGALGWGGGYASGFGGSFAFGGGFGYGGAFSPYYLPPQPIIVIAGPTFPPWPGSENLPFAPRPPVANLGPATRAKKGSPAKAEKLVELGDHLFRSRNISRATERFQQASKADPGLATPHVHLAQVALVRGRYEEAADAFRRAEAVQPGWLLGAKDVQALYAEPADFARHVAKLESHLQTHPNDRDAWFVLGATWFLSGRSRKAADVFIRLSDRRADPALAAFLAASMPEPTPAN